MLSSLTTNRNIDTFFPRHLQIAITIPSERGTKDESEDHSLQIYDHHLGTGNPLIAWVQSPHRVERTGLRHSNLTPLLPLRQRICVLSLSPLRSPVQAV